jgi:pSer/pThr/pTyr-binding forkhead associated (FHA) protein
LNRPEIYIGSAETNDIVIHSVEISKKHLKLIITEDQKCYAIDQGSTNGTFIDDIALVPGRREEFKLFSSLRLGDKILLTLLDKDKGDEPALPLREKFVEEKNLKLADEDKTRVISLKTLQKTKTEKVRKKRLKKIEKEIKKKKQIRKDKDTLNRAMISALVVFGIAFGVMKFTDYNKRRKARHTIVGQVKETQIAVDETIESFDENVVDLHIPAAELIPIAQIVRHADDVTCSLPEEEFFCKRMPLGSRKSNGAVNLNGQIVIYLEQKEWMEKAEALVTSYNELPGTGGSENEPPSIDMLGRIAFLSYVKEYLSGPILLEYENLNLYFVFFNYVGNEIEVQQVFALKGASLKRINSRYSVDFFRFRKYSPFKIIKRFDRFYTVY